MKSFIISLLIIIIAPLLCAGLKCLTCDESFDTQAPCQAGNELAIITCTLHDEKDRSCGIRTNTEGKMTHLGCAFLDHKKAEGCHKAVQNVVPSNGIFRDCECRSDLCNNATALKCLACKGNPIGSYATVLLQTDYKCEKDEIPTERWCSIDEAVCFGTQTGNERSIGCHKYHYPKLHPPLPFCNKLAFGEKECYCKTNVCNNHFMYPPKEPEPEPKTSIGDTLSFSLLLILPLPFINLFMNF